MRKGYLIEEWAIEFLKMLTKLTNEFRLWLRDWRLFFFTIPKKREDKIMLIILFSIWLLSATGIIIAITRR